MFSQPISPFRMKCVTCNDTNTRRYLSTSRLLCFFLVFFLVASKIHLRFEFSFLQPLLHSCNFILYLPIKYLLKHILFFFLLHIIIATFKSQAGASLSLLWIVLGCRKHSINWCMFLKAFWQFIFSSSFEIFFCLISKLLIFKFSSHCKRDSAHTYTFYVEYYCVHSVHK